MFAATIATGGAPAAGSSEEDRYQIDFLNSVIVDQQHKIEELNTKIKVLAEVGDSEHNGYEMDYRYGQITMETFFM